MDSGDSGAARHACGARQPTTRFEAQTARRKEGEKNKIGAEIEEEIPRGD